MSSKMAGRPRKRAEVPERGRRLDAFVRGRWARWLTAGLRASALTPADLAQALAADKDDIQTWPRALVARWLGSTVTVSSENAYNVGEALCGLGVATCGHEAVFAAGHIPAYVSSLEYVAETDELTAARLAILPRVRWASLGVYDAGFALFVDWANGEMAQLVRSHPPEEFRAAWVRYQERRPIPGRTALGSFAKPILDDAYRIAGAQGVPAEQGERLALDLLTTWALDLGLPDDEHGRLQAAAYAYEDHLHAVSLQRRGLPVIEAPKKHEGGKTL